MTRLLLLAALFATPAVAQVAPRGDATVVVRADDGTRYELDRYSQLRAGDEVEVMVVKTPPRPSAKGVARSRLIYRFRCSARTQRLDRFIDYGVDGRVLTEEGAPDDYPFSPAKSGTVGGKLLDAACQ